MKLRMSMFVDAFLGAGVPLGGDPITSFQNVPLLELRTGTVLNNCKPTVGDVVNVRLIGTNCGERDGLRLFPSCSLVGNGTGNIRRTTSSHCFPVSR
jgi:hypothetical protein